MRLFLHIVAKKNAVHAVAKKTSLNVVTKKTFHSYDK